MGDPRKISKKYERPKHPWLWKNLREEGDLVKNYGLKSKKEVWKAQSKVRRFRKIARKITGETGREKEKKKLINKLREKGMIRKKGSLDDVLSMDTEDYLERRLQTIAWRKGFGRTPQQARQLITHGHIKINGRKCTKPSMIVPKTDEDNIDWYGREIEEAKGGKKPVTREVKEKVEKEKRPKEPKKPKEEAEEDTGELEYEEIVKENISDVKEESKGFRKEEYEKLLEAEKQNKDRKTLKKWIEKQIEKGE